MSTTADYNRQRIIHMVKKHAEDKECPKCKIKGKWKIVPVFEFGDLDMPSQVVLLCDSCKKYNETFAQAPDDQARAYANGIKKEMKGFQVGKPGDADKLIKLK